MRALPNHLPRLRLGRARARKPSDDLRPDALLQRPDPILEHTPFAVVWRARRPWRAPGRQGEARVAHEPNASRLSPQAPQGQQVRTLSQLRLKRGGSLLHHRAPDLLPDAPRKPFEHPQPMPQVFNLITTNRLNLRLEPRRPTLMPGHPMREGGSERLVETSRTTTSKNRPVVGEGIPRRREPQQLE